MKDKWILTPEDQINFTQLVKHVLRVQPSNEDDYKTQGWVRASFAVLAGGVTMTFLGDASKKFDDLWKEHLKELLKKGEIETI